MSTKADRGWNLYRRRADGQWVLSFRTAPGMWKETRIPREHRTERTAERYAQAWLAEYRKNAGQRPTLAQPDEDAPTIKSLSDRWLDLRENDDTLRPATRAQSQACMRLHILPDPIASLPLATLGWQDLERWTARVSKGKAPFTARNVCNTMSAFLQTVLVREWCPIRMNWMRHPEVRKKIPLAETLVEKAGDDKVVFTQGQVEALLGIRKDVVVGQARRGCRSKRTRPRASSRRCAGARGT